MVIFNHNQVKLNEESGMIITEYVFRKRDGSIRTLRGTMDFKTFADKNPETWDVIKPKGEKKACTQNITLIDVEINQWRFLLL